MAIMLYLAMTHAEMSNITPLPLHLAYMACHFSAQGPGLEAPPPDLPEGAILTLNDQVPPADQDPDQVAQELEEAVVRLDCKAVLLDLQRPGDALTAQIARTVARTLSCPVCVSAAYAQDLECPVLVPPVPPSSPLQDHLAPWQGRRIWLEVSTQGSAVTVDGQGCKAQIIPPPEGPLPHFDPALVCHYRTQVLPEKIVFTLWRTREDQLALWEQAQSLGAELAVGLYQELALPAPMEPAQIPHFSTKS